LAISTFLVGCYYSTAEEKPATEARPILAAKAVLADDAPAKGDWSSLKGQIVFAGDVPAPKEITITKDEKDCKDALKGTPLVSEEWVVNKDNKGVRWVFVWIAPTDPKGKLAIHPDLAAIKEPKVFMDQPCCHFEPHCLALRQGQIWVAKNSSAIPHNVHYEGSKNPGDNPILPAGKEVEIKDLKAELGPITVNCNIHPWMKAWVRVFDHPYYTITDADGKFEIKNAPAGDCLLYIWHEGEGWVHQGGKKGQPITLNAGETMDLGKVEAKP
jgi:hypothetical protein